MTRTSRLAFRSTPLAFVFALGTLAAACSDGPTSPSSADAGGTAPSAPAPAPAPVPAPAPAPAPSPAPAPVPAVVGTYRFASVNGRAVPGVFETFSAGLGVTMAMEAVRGQLIFNADGTYLQEMEMRLLNSIAEPKVLSKGTAGIWSMPGGVLTMTPFQGQPFQPHYMPGLIEIQTEAPGLDGNPEVYIFSFRK